MSLVKWRCFLRRCDACLPRGHKQLGWARQQVVKHPDKSSRSFLRPPRRIWPRGWSRTARGRSAKLALGPVFTLHSVSTLSVSVCVCVCLPLLAGQRWSALCEFSHGSSSQCKTGAGNGSPEDSHRKFNSRASGDGGPGRIAACHNNLEATFVKEQRTESGAGGRLLCWIGVDTRQVSWTREPDKRNKSLF